MLCVVSSAMDLALNHLVKVASRSGSGKGYVSRQQLWLTNLVRTLLKKSGYSCLSKDKRPHVFGAARSRYQVENPETRYCYLNSSTSDKLFNTFVSKRTDDSDQIECIIEKKVGEKVERSDFETKSVISRLAPKGFLQNRQMSKASKKDWETDIAYIRNVFAYGMVKSIMDQSQVREIYTPPRCRMGIIHVGNYDVKGSE